MPSFSVFGADHEAIMEFGVAYTGGPGRPRRPRMIRALAGAAILAVPLGVVPSIAHAAPRPARVHDVQGAAHVSPLKGAAVVRVPGVVTAVTGTGFWMQDPKPDRRPATSEGIFVFTRSRPSVTPGDAVQVDGRVSEFRPGGADSGGLTRTEIGSTKVAVTGRTTVPSPVLLGPKGVRPPSSVVKSGHGDVERGGAFDPGRNGLDFFEALEGMQVRLEDAVAVGPTRFGELPVLPAGGAGVGNRTGRGGILQRDGDANPERIVLDDTLAPLPNLNVGDRLPGDSVGVVDYALGHFKVLPTVTPRHTAGGLPREATRPQRPGEIAIATIGLGELSPNTPRERFRAVADDIVKGLASPDLVAVDGLQDNSGRADDGTVAADQTVAELITAISAAGGPAYEWRSVEPRDNADGGDKGSNPRVGFLFRTDRGLTFVDRPAQTGTLPDEPPAEKSDPAVTAVRAVAQGRTTGLSRSPGRIAPRDSVWAGTRKPLAGEVTWQGERIIVVAGEWYPSTADDDPLFGRNQPPEQPTRWRRDAQAKVVAGFVRSVQKVDRNANVVVAGRLNDTPESLPVQALAQTGLTDLPAGLPPRDRYTAVTQGNAQALDHIMLSRSLKGRGHEFDIVHRSAEFADRPGEHDPTIVRIDLAGEDAPRTPGSKPAR
ncbi:endonuclease/exonuclease/phosphatase [Actinomadura sp. LOL_011]|uniref:endonuclease/exonuclease/phosphatase n=1 Tax=Actinomadura sp. LOL_011 TaxID=3345410 RepID=UPI003A80DFA6